MAVCNHYGAYTDQKETDDPPPELDDPQLRLLFHEYVHSSHYHPVIPEIMIRTIGQPEEKIA